MPQHADYVGDVAEALSIKYNNLVYEMKARGEDIIVLSLGEAFFDIPLYSFADLPFPAIYHYSHSRGVPQLRQKLAAYYANQYRVPVDPETEIIVTAGSKIAIHMAFMAILNPGDEIIVHEPAWVSYPEQIKLCHGVPVMVPYSESTFDIAKYITPRTKGIMLNYPHNPRGRVLAKAEWEHLHDLARRHDIYLISDEAYSDFVSDKETFVSCGVFDPGKEHSIICNSMSKNYGMSGWRLGYLMSNPSLTFQILKINQHLITCPATILQYYLEKHFDDILAVTKPQIREAVRNRESITRHMDSLGMSYLPGSSTFYIFVSIQKSELTSQEFCMKLLTEHQVSTVPGLGYGVSCDQFIRVSIGTESMERTMHGIHLINDLVHKTAPKNTRPQIGNDKAPHLD